MSALGCSARQFSVFRVTLGLYLAYHFAALSSFSGEIYGRHGMFPPEIRTPFPNLIAAIERPESLQLLFVGLAGIAMLFAAGFKRRAFSLVLWYGWACMTNRVPFLYIPSEGLVGWLLLFSAATPGGEEWSLSPRARRDWEMPPAFIMVAWVVLGVGYFASGLDKLESPSWQAGTAIRSVLTSPISRWEFAAELAQSSSGMLIQAASGWVVAIELSFLFLIWHPLTRLSIWIASTLMHLGIRLLLDLHTISDAFLIAHLLIFDQTWLQRRQPGSDSITEDREATIITI